MRSDSRGLLQHTYLTLSSMCQYQHALQGQHLSQNEHKGLLMDRGFRVSFLVTNET